MSYSLLLDAVRVPCAGQTAHDLLSERVVTADLAGSGDVTAELSIQTHNGDGVWQERATISLSGTDSDSGSASFSSTDPYTRAVVSAMTGDSAAVTAQMESQSAADKLSDLPVGGTTGQALVKSSDADGDVDWADVAGGVPSDASGNTAAGTGALAAVTTGANSTAVGKNALAAADTNANTAVGSGTLALLTGFGNTAVGAGAGANATTGNTNVVAGYNAAHNLTTGSNNVVIGSQAASPLAAGSGNVILGQGAGAGLGDVSNTVVFGIGTGAQIALTLDEVGNKLHFAVLYSDGMTAKAADVALA